MSARSMSARCPKAPRSAPTGNYLYVGNFIDQDLWVLRVDGSKLTDTGSASSCRATRPRCAPARNRSAAIRGRRVGV